LSDILIDILLKILKKIILSKKKKVELYKKNKRSTHVKLQGLISKIMSDILYEQFND